MLHGHVYVVVYPINHFSLVLYYTKNILHQIVNVSDVFGQFVYLLVVVLGILLELILLEQ